MLHKFREFVQLLTKKHVARRNASTPSIERLPHRELFSCFVARFRVGLSTSGRQTGTRAGTFVRRMNSGQEEEGCQEGGWIQEGREEEIREEEIALAHFGPA